MPRPGHRSIHQNIEGRETPERGNRMKAFTFFLSWELNCQFAGPIWAHENGLYSQAAARSAQRPTARGPHRSGFGELLRCRLDQVAPFFQ